MADDPFDPWLEPKPTTPWTNTVGFYQRVLPPLMAVLCVLWLLSVLIWKPTGRPPVGTFIGLLAFLAVVVTIWPPTSNRSKAAWLAVFFCLTGLEIANLYQERAENQKQLLAAQKTEDDRFSEILTQNQKDFNATVLRLGSLADQQQDALDEINGGESFPYVQFVGTGLQAFLFEKGHHPLSQMTVQIMDLTAIGEMHLPSGSPVPYLYTHSFPEPTRYGALLTTPLFTMEPPKHETEILYIVIKALNGEFSELLLIHHSKSGWPQAYQITAFFRPTVGNNGTKRAGVV